MSFDILVLIACLLAVVGLALGVCLFTGISSDALWLILLVLTSVVFCLT